ncbi:MAG: ATP-binding protein [Patescibacteria group bacterium]|nr:ATP-binding protein [Patescibacteria group bacterium]
MPEMIKRLILKPISDKLSKSNKIVIIYGARQVGKTTLVEQLIAELSLKTLKINADELKYHDILSSRDLDKMKSLVSGYELLFIDEAQRIENIGINLKILADGLPDLKIIVTGSSSFELSNKIKEPLTGRTWTYNLFSLSFLELSAVCNEFELKSLLDNILIFGSYPGVFNLENISDKKKLLEEISSSYLYKDILELERIKKSDKIYKLLKLLAFQIGQEVSVNELAVNLELSHEKIRKYLDLLEKSFIIYRLSALSKNPRKEIAKKDKIYFYDIGVRNIVIDNLKPLSDRNDQGALFENFLVSERVKKNNYQEKFVSAYFWRAYTGSEIDYVEEEAGKFRAYEFKYRKKTSRIPKKFFDSYGKSEFKIINKDNFLEFII